MRDRNRLSRGGSAGNGKPEAIARQLDEVVRQAFIAKNGEPSVHGGMGSMTRPSAVQAAAGAVDRPVEIQDPANAKNPTLEGEQIMLTSEKDANYSAGARFPLWKRLLDILCVLLTTPLWLPLMILAALAIKTVSRGPVFFLQRRIGLGGCPFMILKFRSMQVNADTRTHEGYVQQLMQSDCPMTKLDASGDSRLIPGGRLLRATALDELPQIFNVLRGDMSLVGPRPCTPAEFENYQPRHKERCQFPPGLTGYWQVNGKNKTTFSEMIEMDLHYGKQMSIWLDICIMAKTFPAIMEQVVESQMRRMAAKKTVCEQVPAFETIKKGTN